MNLISFYLLSAPEGGEQSPYSSFFFIFLIIAIFYLFMIRPQQKKMKQAKVFRESLKKGNKVVTIGGIHGKIEAVKDNTIVLIVEDGNKIRVEKSAISSESSSSETEIAQRKK